MVDRFPNPHWNGAGATAQLAFVYRDIAEKERQLVAATAARNPSGTAG
jgi:hypothetical protein